jgi:hypothetical protein
MPTPNLILAFFLTAAFFSNGFTQKECINCFQKTLNKRYEATDTAIEASRNIIMDFIRDKKWDSIPGLVANCDSIFSPDSSWLSYNERYLLNIILEKDSTQLYDLDYYQQNYPVYDATQPEKVKAECNKSPRYGSRFFGNDETSLNLLNVNLTRIFRSIALREIQENGKKYPHYNDAWCFFMIMDTLYKRPNNRGSHPLEYFKSRFPHSVFSRLKVIDEDYYSLIHGRFVWPLLRYNMQYGQVYEAMAAKPYSMFGNHISGIFVLEGDMNVSWSMALYVKCATIHTRAPVYSGSELLETGLPLEIWQYGLDCAKIIKVSEMNYLRPTFGVFTMQTHIPADTISPKHTPYFRFTTCFGLKIGADFEYTLIKTRIDRDDLLGPYLRFSIGVRIAEFPLLGSGFSNYAYFAGISVVSPSIFSWMIK